jgi:GntR family transcriptional regulator
MRKALDLLEGERLLTRRQGRGTFVNDQASEELAVRFSNVRGPGGERVSGEAKSTEVSEGVASEDECVRLRLRRQDRVLRIKRVRCFKDQPFMVERATLPAALFPELIEKEGASHRIVVLAQQYGIMLGKAAERVAIGVAPPEVAAALGVAPDTPVLVLDRVVQALDGRPVEWRIGHCNFADQYYLTEMI